MPEKQKIFAGFRISRDNCHNFLLNIPWGLTFHTKVAGETIFEK